MKLVTFLDRKETKVGVLLDDKVLDLSQLSRTAGWIKRKPQRTNVFDDMISLIEAGREVIPLVTEAVDGSIILKSPKFQKLLLSRNRIEIMAPIPHPRKNIFCVGLNYAEHVKEGAAAAGRSAAPPEYPTFFTKSPTAVIGPDEAVILDRRVTQSLDYEVELGVILGHRGINIPEAQALSYVFGYTIINDISARDLQRRHGQWFKGKSLDTTCPMGPCIVLSQDIPDPQNLDIRLYLNGQEMQSSNTRYMIFGIAKLISQLSQGMVLEPGDILATGTPSGVGSHRQPPVFLKEGDVLEAQIEGIGILRNPVAARP